ncbi:V-type ATP synthase subunit F [Methanomassiliicoccus luminyensis]|jgi:V/A-type H+-transporting ATPase subunit F|uniref:V-type ATP synthase subunit F n=1 Tax=Methanomassiliicoccus luminyensis TaxID=1080712 RepID=UPI00035F18A9|nr:V-type ATP synthase subunit F [Methanomassiliicoccus luminyensis]
MEFAVLGREEFVLGFRLAGVTRVYAVQPEGFEEAILSIIDDSSVGILAVDAKDLSRVSANTRRKALESISPVVIQVGGDEGDLREKVKSAIGVDLYKTERD